jgi:hypothetical protein
LLVKIYLFIDKWLTVSFFENFRLVSFLKIWANLIITLLLHHMLTGLKNYIWFLHNWLFILAFIIFWNNRVSTFVQGSKSSPSVDWLYTFLRVYLILLISIFIYLHILMKIFLFLLDVSVSFWQYLNVFSTFPYKLFIVVYFVSFWIQHKII